MHTREITLDDADITWRVHVANRKAAAVKFAGSGTRNPDVSPEKLVIDPGEKSIAGASAPRNGCKVPSRIRQLCSAIS